MSIPEKSSIGDICCDFREIAEEVGEERWISVEVSIAIQHLTESLENFTPGLEIPPNKKAAEALHRGAKISLDRGDSWRSAMRALLGLRFQPHHPGLFCVLALACFEFERFTTAHRLFCHAVWINPGHVEARECRDATADFLGLC